MNEPNGILLHSCVMKDFIAPKNKNRCGRLYFFVNVSLRKEAKNRH